MPRAPFVAYGDTFLPEEGGQSVLASKFVLLP